MASVIGGSKAKPRLATDLFYIVDVRSDWRTRPYITLWRPNNANYSYATEWAGQYTRAQIDAAAHYYTKRRYEAKPGRRRAILERFPVPVAVVDRMGIAPERGIIDGDVGLVIPNTPAARGILGRNRYVSPALLVPDSEGDQ